jgi:ABC-2 type transport system permease protein
VTQAGAANADRVARDGIASASPFGTRLLSQLAMELRLTARRGENVLATIVVPIALLAFFVAYPIGLPYGRAVETVVPAIVAVAVIAAGLVNLGIATAYERSFGVLKRLGASPLSRPALVLAKIGSVVVLEIVQLALIVLVAIGLFGWRPPAVDGPSLLVALVLGTACFSGLGLLLAGTLRAEATLALANGLFLAFVLVGGVVVPAAALPAALGAIARVLPAAALADALRAALGGPVDPALAGAAPLVVLGAWSVLIVAAASRLFRWE